MLYDHTHTTLSSNLSALLTFALSSIKASLLVSGNKMFLVQDALGWMGSSAKSSAAARNLPNAMLVW
jgi:hypothetical protein